MSEKRKDKAHKQADRIVKLILAMDLKALDGPAVGGVLDDLRIACDDAGDNWQEWMDAKLLKQGLDHYGRKLPPKTVKFVALSEDAKRRAIRNENRLNDQYAGAVEEPFQDALEEWEFYHTYYPDHPIAKQPKPEEG